MAQQRTWTLAVDAGLWLVAGAVIVAVVGGSLAPQAPAPLSLSDKVLHTLGYLTLTLSVLLAAVWRPGRGPGIVSRGAAVVAGAYALGPALELLQGVVGREPDVLDALANAVGVTAGLLVWRALGGRAASKRPLNP
jgi:VanZ family protein